MGTASRDTSMLPLAVDLDGTLIDGDLLVLSLRELVRRQPFHLVQLPFWLLRGKSRFKYMVGNAIAWSIDVTTLSYRSELVDWIRAQHERGRFTVLATASPDIYARRIAQHLGLFDEVFATTETENLVGIVKARQLVKRFGRQEFVYAGDSTKDIPVWEAAAAAIPVYAKARLSAWVQKRFSVERTFG